MKVWKFAKMDGSRIRIDDRLASDMGLVDGGCVYSTLFRYSDCGPKEYELILSMYPQENYRTLTHITIYMQDVPGATAQAAAFLGKRNVNILNSISLNAISDTVIIWKMLVDLSFSGEADIIIETFNEMKSGNDESVSKLDHVETKPADIGRVFRSEASMNKNKSEVRRGTPATITDNTFDVSKEYNDILNEFDGSDVLITVDPESWILSITFFKKNVKLIKMGFEIPDCPGSIGQIVGFISGKGVNLVSVFSKVKICYQTMSLEMVADLHPSGISMDELKSTIENNLDNMNGIFELKEYRLLR